MAGVRTGQQMLALVPDRAGEEIDDEHAGDDQDQPDDRSNIQRLLEPEPADGGDQHDSRT